MDYHDSTILVTVIDFPAALLFGIVGIGALDLAIIRKGPEAKMKEL